MGHTLVKGKVIKQLQYLEIFSRTTWLITTKLGTKHPWVNKIQVFTIRGIFNSKKGDNGIIVPSASFFIDWNCFSGLEIWSMGLLFSFFLFFISNYLHTSKILFAAKPTLIYLI